MYLQFPGVIGAIDGTHIKIIAPKDRSESYINRKGYHSIQLQVVCNADLKFIHCYYGQVGSVHDNRVFRLLNIENMCTNAYFLNDSHILRDAVYCISKYVMVPFKDNGHSFERQINFNKRLSSTRMMAERSLGLLKGRWKSFLDTLPMQRTDLISKYIIACCILHNICLLKNDIIDIPLIIDESDFREEQFRIIENNTVQNEVCDTAHDMWKKLSTIHEQRLSTNKVSLLEDFHGYAMEPGCTMAQHVARVQNRAFRLRDIG
ncbi:putative nuclease HARBI1 [Solenopsis invicta]|uniref:putative nuclease HARBI1 n=1 Tax=Solenopsis invicta TaxID=13686 RepID=UPI00193E4BD8|nr:putative nuclease HARBI1 [Solenopsis invicta]